jgi:hypothetical protein
MAMGMLKRKEEKSATISVRVPASVKAELEELRQRAEAAGFDLTATLKDALVRWAKQVREELGQLAQSVTANAHPDSANGIDGSAEAAKKLVS